MGNFIHDPSPLPPIPQVQTAVLWGLAGPVAADLGHAGTMPGMTITNVDVKFPHQHDIYRDVYMNPILDVGYQFEMHVDAEGEVLRRSHADADQAAHMIQPFALLPASALAFLRASDTRGFISSSPHADDHFLVSKAETKNERQKIGVDSFTFMYRRYTLPS